MESSTNARLGVADLIQKGTRVSLSFKFTMLYLWRPDLWFFLKCLPFSKCCEERAQKHKLRREQNVPRDLSSPLPFHLAFSDTWWILDRSDDCDNRMQYLLLFITWKGWSSRRTSGSTPYTWRPGLWIHRSATNREAESLYLATAHTITMPTNLRS